VSYRKIVAKGDNGVTALLTSVNDVRRMEGKGVLAKKDITDTAEGGSYLQLLNEEQLAQILGKLGAYRLAVIEPRHEFRPRLSIGSGKEGALIYICFDGNRHWDGVRLISPYAGYPIPVLADDEAIVQCHPDSGDSQHARLSFKLKGYIAPEAYSDYQRNSPYLKIPITRIRTWAGVATGEKKMREGLRSIPQKMRAGKRNILKFAGLKQVEKLARA
jgi:hypothetical protein